MMRFFAKGRLTAVLTPLLLRLAFGQLALEQQACTQPTTVLVDGQRVSVDKVAEEAFQRAKQKESAGDTAGAKAELKKIVSDYKDAEIAPTALFELGSLSMKDKDYPAAKKSFGDLLLNYPTSKHAKEARRAFASAAILLGDWRDADETLKAVLRETSGEDKRAAAEDLQQAASKVGDGAGLIEALAARLEAGSGNRAQLEAQVLQAIDRDLKAADIDRLLKDARQIGLGFAMDLLWLKSARVAMHTGDFTKAKQAAQQASSSSNPAYAKQAKAFLDQLAQLEHVKSKAIGVLLPMTGDKKQFGQSALSAIKLALGLEGDGPSSGIELVVRDTEGDAEKAQRAVDDLATNAHVIAIIGPLFAEESLSAAVRAESYGLPMINLSRRDGIPQIGPNIFRLCLTPKQQAQALTKLAFDVLGMKRFAIFYPNIPLGTEMANLFWDEVEQKNGEVRGIEAFDYDQTTFTTQVKRLVGRFYTEARSDYYKGLNEIGAQKLTGIKRQQAVEKMLKSLPPVTDFDGLFIPANAKQVGMIAPALAFEDIVTTQNAEELKRIAKTTGRDTITPIRLLGTNTWNSSQTAERGQKFVEGAIFVDGFFAQDPAQKVQKFVKQFTDLNQREPALPDAQAFDAAAVVRDAVSKNPTNRAGLRKLLEETKAFQGVTGKISFDSDGEAQKDLYYLTIEKGQIVKFEAPERG
jgi:branched-chain amino acid transport system substrate-binding protein